MNLLITNTREEQPYLIIRSLVDEADRIVVTLNGDNWFERWAGMAQWSRFVSKRYIVPDCSVDWKSGLIQPENTPAEEQYIQRIEEICAAEGIDVIYPSYDSEVYVFTKNRGRLSEQGITAVTPDYKTLISVLDKSLTLEAARKTGFPAPKTRIPRDLDELEQVARDIDAPWVLKPRLNAHGANVMLARDWQELERAFTRLSESQERPLVQEFIPAATKRNFYMVVNRDSEIISLFSPRVERTRKVGLVTPCAAVVSTRDVPFTQEVESLMRELGFWGGMTLQTVIDQRDGKPRLMEINPRFGHNLWYRTELGMNEPRMFLRLAQGRDPFDGAGEPPAFEEGVILLDPLWDGFHLVGQMLDQSLAWVRGLLGGRPEKKSPLEKEPLGPLLKAYRSEYFSRRPRRTSPLNRGWLSDPLPPLVRFIKTTLEALLKRAR